MTSRLTRLTARKWKSSAACCSFTAQDAKDRRVLVTCSNSASTSRIEGGFQVDNRGCLSVCDRTGWIYHLDADGVSLHAQSSPRFVPNLLPIIIGGIVKKLDFK